MADLQAHVTKGSRPEPRSQTGKQLVKGRRLSVNKRRKKDFTALIIQEPATRLNYDSDRTFNDMEPHKHSKV